LAGATIFGPDSLHLTPKQVPDSESDTGRCAAAIHGESRRLRRCAAQCAESGPNDRRRQGRHAQPQRKCYETDSARSHRTIVLRTGLFTLIWSYL